MLASPLVPSHRGAAAPRRWLGVGRSAEGDARRAGATATAAALMGDDPRLLVVFCWDGYDAAALLAGIREAAGDVPLVGCSTAGEIAGDGPGDAGVVVTALGGEGFAVATAAGAVATVGSAPPAPRRTACAAQVADAPHRVLLLLSDGLAGDQQEAVRGAYRWWAPRSRWWADAPGTACA